MNEETLALDGLACLIGVHRQNREIGNQLQILPQNIGKINVVGTVIIAEQSQDASLHAVHQVLIGTLHNDVPEKVGGKCPVACKLAAEIL